MRRTYIPFIYKVGNTYVFRRTRKVGDEIITSTKIFYRLDLFEYKIIDKDYNNSEYSNKEINTICGTIVGEMNKMFLD